MTGDYERYRIGGAGPGDRTREIYVSKLQRNIGIRAYLSTRNRAKDFPHLGLKRRSADIEREIRLRRRSDKILGYHIAISGERFVIPAKLRSR
jgi:hypothetical protein